MDSTIFTRRTLLGGGALVGLGALLTACGQQANNEAAATASAAPSETAAVSDTTSASATPSPRVTRGYSGNSKAPDGEYRKADGYGPAQNLADGNPWSEDGETYFWKAYREWDSETYVESDGSWRKWSNDDKTDDTFKFEMKHNGQKWEIMNYEPVED